MSEGSSLRYIRIEPVEVRKASLTMARIIAGKNLRPELNPKLQEDGYLINSEAWLKEDEFAAAPYYPAEKKENHD